MFDRVKNLYKLSGANITNNSDGTLSVQTKPDKRPAIILEDVPDLFPTEDPENI